MTYMVDTDCGHLAPVCLSGLSTASLSPLHRSLEGGCHAHPVPEEGLLPPLPRMEQLRTHGFSRRADSLFSSYSHLFTDTHLCQFGSVGVCLSFGVEPCTSLFSCSDCSGFDGWEFIHWLLCPFDVPPSLCVCVFALFCFLSVSFLSCAIRYSRPIFCVACLCPKNQEPGSFDQKMV